MDFEYLLLTIKILELLHLVCIFTLLVIQMKYCEVLEEQLETITSMLRKEEAYDRRSNQVLEPERKSKT